MAKRNYKSIVIKIGSSTLTAPSGKLDVPNLKRIVAEAAELVKQKKQVILVTSGAVVSGSEKLGIRSPKSIPEKQAAAAIGQSILMRQYEKAFEEHGIITAQVLLTRDAIANRERYLNARNCISTLLRQNVVPIVNENDAVAIEEIKIGDNDTLAALTASLIEADLLVILTDVDGFYMKNEEGVPYLVEEVEKITRETKDAAGSPSSRVGTGGMITKIQAAEICSNAGALTAIINGRKPGLITALVSGERVGTLFFAAANKIESRKRWLAYGLKKEGTIVVDTGAELALIKNKKSLLSVGIIGVKGKFPSGALVSITDESGKEFARGLANLNNEELVRAMGKKGGEEAIHRDNLVIL